MQRVVGGTIAVVLINLMWLTLGRLIVAVDAGDVGMLSGEATLTYLLLFGAPAATFVPLRRWTGLPLYDLEGIAGWSTLGFILAFLRPSTPPSLGQFLVFVLALIVVLATVCTLVAHLVGLRIYRDGRRPHDTVRSRRQGYLAATFIVALLVLHGIGTLTPISGTLLLGLVVLAELFTLSRHTARPANARVAGRYP